MDLDLATRPGLPDALRVLLRDFPREAWEADPNFHGLVSFWLGMHVHFRDELAAMRQEAEAVLDRRMEPRAWAGRLSRRGSGFVEHLHGHHGIEDNHYFPILVTRDARLERGFEILDTDHHALDAHLDAFVQDANGALQALQAPAFRTQAGRFQDGLLRLDRFLDRHLTDEEDLIVPVILRDGEAGLR
ncbi:hemerythrin domain-containing protein [Rubellimicrobium roseum]|uniref:Hemerythrin domain-containing protein n=1 Tax=Rubellimicrobium roseum TaxID=687525 RepID=A0A5C4NQ98_9RHOB|nr:hemerythrin domain-containing protein [Rubellimicrobium roseum]TNC74847.1 hemerythrin domain-containing protein [Rubellimicrobium roseum]